MTVVASWHVAVPALRELGLVWAPEVPAGYDPNGDLVEVPDWAAAATRALADYDDARWFRTDSSRERLDRVVRELADRLELCAAVEVADALGGAGAVLALLRAQGLVPE